VIRGKESRVMSAFLNRFPVSVIRP
jgi:hypothetical protein